MSKLCTLFILSGIFFYFTIPAAADDETVQGLYNWMVALHMYENGMKGVKQTIKVIAATRTIKNDNNVIYAITKISEANVYS